uniref:Uncharacterized protein n=1 Tax=viral metagenome TaxID=1070528 RepID=A0A6M3M801_9ZZZZ
MFYEFAITVPANTTQASPKKQELELTHGIIQRIDVQFPIGTLALAHCRLEHHSFGHLPTNPTGSFATDGFIIPVDEYLEFFSAPYKIKAICWNDDDTYAHTVTIRISIMESKRVLMFMNILKGLTKLLQLMGIKV